MQLNRQKQFTRLDLLGMFGEVYTKRLERNFLKESTSVAEWDLTGYVDGPLTFVAATHPSGVVYTGWAKFNANDKNYVEHGGLYRALQRAVDKYAEELAYRYSWGLEEALKRATKEEQFDEVHADGSTERVTQRT